MLNILRWLFTTLWLASLIIGLVIVQNKLEQVTIPEPAEMDQRKAQQKARLEIAENLASAVQRDAIILRDYLLTGDQQLRAERNKLWVDRIWPAHQEIREVAVELEGEGEERLTAQIDIIYNTVEDLDRAGTETMSLAFTPDNEPALASFNNEIANRHQGMRDRLTKVIELERNLPATVERMERQEFLTLVREQLGALMADLELYLRSGQDVYRDNFEVDVVNLQQTRQALEQRAELFTDAQKTAFNGFFTLYNEWQAELPIVVAARQEPDWNTAHYQLQTRIQPNLNRVLDATDYLRQKLMQEVAKPVPLPGADLLEEQLQQVLASFWMLYASGALGVVAVILTLIPAPRPKEEYASSADYTSASD